MFKGALGFLLALSGLAGPVVEHYFVGLGSVNVLLEDARVVSEGAERRKQYLRVPAFESRPVDAHALFPYSSTRWRIA